VNANEFRGKHIIFYVIYILVNIITFGTPWFITNLIGYGVAKGSEKEKD
jgi:hypothetical protein